MTLPSTHLSFLHFLTTCLPFLSRGNIFHRPTWGAVKESSLSKRLFVPHPTPSSHQERGLHPATYCPFHLVVKVFFLHATLPPELLKKKKEEDSQHHALSPLFIVSHEVAKSFTKQPEHCRQRLQVPEEVITTGMSSSKSTVRRTAEWQRGGGQDTVWGRNINWNVLSWNGSAFCFRGNFWQLGILLVSAVLQSNTSRICLRNLKPVNT